MFMTKSPLQMSNTCYLSVHFPTMQAPVLCILAAIEAYRELKVDLPINLQVTISWHMYQPSSGVKSTFLEIMKVNQHLNRTNWII